MSVRWALLVEYDGTDFAGWQHQKNGPSVQAALEEALARLTGHPVRLVGAGRTDAGVHALGQVAAFTTEKPLRADNVVRGGNTYLPPTVRIRAVRKVPEDFNPRREAIGRHYLYRIVQGGTAPAIDRSTVSWSPGSMDWDRVREALRVLQGRHDFAAFRSSQCRAHRTVLTLERAEVLVSLRGPEADLGTMAEFHFECRSFLHNMVRMLMGAVCECGFGRLKIKDLSLILEGGGRGNAQFPTAPAKGLCLVSVRYPQSLGLW